MLQASNNSQVTFCICCEVCWRFFSDEWRFTKTVLVKLIEFGKLVICEQECFTGECGRVTLCLPWSELFGALWE
jgi:hypothetical protein